MGLRKNYIGQPYASYTHADPFAPKRWVHQKRFQDALALLETCDRTAVLDYGTGDGHFLELCRARFPESELWGYDPVVRNGGPNVSSPKIVSDPHALPREHFTTITLFETAEHLPDQELHQVLETIKTLLAPGGRVIISVPVEVGLPAMIKNLYRAVRRKDYERLTFLNYFKAIFGIPFERKVNVIDQGLRYIHTHMGFSHRRFERILKEHWTIQQRIGTPVKLFGAALNTSLYYVVIPQ